jgi:ABC-2 type transport system permease protein
MRAVGAFVQRDFRVALSHTIPFALDLLAALFTVLTFLFVSRIVGSDEVPGGYLPFVMVGLAVAAFLDAGVTILAGNVRQEQLQGTLEVTVAAGLPIPMLAAGIAAYPLTAAAVRAVIYVAFAALVGVRVPGANWGLAVAATILGSISFAGLGLVGAALVLAIRQAAAATAWLVTVLTLAAGTFFPRRVLPEWAQWLGEASPFTQTLRLVRQAVLRGVSWGDSGWTLLLLVMLAVLFGGLGVAALGLGITWARRNGSLAQY